jgi:hypothetical protein
MLGGLYDRTLPSCGVLRVDVVNGRLTDEGRLFASYLGEPVPSISVDGNLPGQSAHYQHRALHAARGQPSEIGNGVRASRMRAHLTETMPVPVGLG